MDIIISVMLSKARGFASQYKCIEIRRNKLIFLLSFQIVNGYMQAIPFFKFASNRRPKKCCFGIIKNGKSIGLDSHLLSPFVFKSEIVDKISSWIRFKLFLFTVNAANNDQKAEEEKPEELKSRRCKKTR